MSRIVAVTASPILERQIQEAAGGDATVFPLWPLPTDPWDVLSPLSQPAPPEVVVVDTGIAPEQALKLAANFEEQYPYISVVLVSDTPEEIGIAAMRAGVRDVVPPTADASEIRLVLERAAQAAAGRFVPPAAAPATAPVQEDTRSQRGTVICVTSPKGGVGKTTVATNLAVGLARSAPNSTVIVDLDVQFGDVASALNLDPQYALPDAVQPNVRRDSMLLKTFLTLHPTGLYAICGAASPEEADDVTPEAVDELIRTLAADFQWVIVDTAPGMTPHTLSALDHSNELILVAGMDVPAVRGMRKALDTLQDLGIFADNRTIVLNFVDSHGGLTIGDIETAIGTKVDVTLPRSRAVTASVNQGVPLLQSSSRDPMARQLRGLVERFTPPGGSAAPENNGWRGRGRQRRKEEAAR